jgi:hypothetical protein
MAADTHFLAVSSVQEDLDRLWNWDFRDAASDQLAPSMDDMRVQEKMNSSITTADGRYQLSLPWKDTAPFASNKFLAQSRLKHLEKRLRSSKELKMMYDEQINDYISNGYAEIAPPNHHPTKTWYLPHHPVSSDRKPGKVRVVFDGAAKYNGMSINDRLLQGPDLTNSLTAILMRFRLHPIAVTADIKAMYHQVLVHEEDRDALRFLWWPDGDLDQPALEYRMTRHVFGLRSSPTCATFALRRTAADNSTSFCKNTVDTVHNDFYVDDLLKSFPTVQDAR